MKKKGIATILAVAMLSTYAFTAVACATDKDEQAQANYEQSSGLSASDFETKCIGTQAVLLSASTPMTLASTANYVEQTLTATVLPATATNKKVDWSVAWADGQSGTVTDYVTITPSSDGSTTATVKCYKAFTGNIVITVTTRESGYTAECLVTFVGIPTEIALMGTISESSDGYYYFGIGNDYTYTVKLDNIFGIVGDSYQDITLTYGAVGSVVLGYCEYYVSSGNYSWYDEKMSTVALSSLVDSFISASYENGSLTITTKQSIESYYESMERLDSGRTRAYTNKFYSYADDESDCYFYVKLSQTSSGVSKIIKFKFDETVVTGVETNKAQVYF